MKEDTGNDVEVQYKKQKMMSFVLLFSSLMFENVVVTGKCS